MQNYVVPILVGIIIFGGISWLIFLLHLFLAKIGFYKHFTYNKLRKKFRDYEFEEKIISFCEKAVVRGWKYKDIKLFAKGRKNAKEILYTYIVISKLMRTGQYTRSIEEIKAEINQKEDFYEEI